MIKHQSRTRAAGNRSEREGCKTHDAEHENKGWSCDKWEALGTESKQS